MRLSDFDYHLPEELIAQEPADKRDHSRLMVLDKEGGNIEHKDFKDLPGFLQSGDILVINDTKVIPARLYGKRVKTGAEIEIVLLHERENNVWEALARPGKKVRSGEKIDFGKNFEATVLGNTQYGGRVLEFGHEGEFDELLHKHGEMPLPPYITKKLEDPDRYQTIYAEKAGSAAAPTAGLHFTDEIFESIRAKGVKIARITLHVGLGTFRPVKTESIEEHKMHEEYYVVDQVAAQMINTAKNSGGRIIAVGTTSVRTLETVADENGLIKPQSGWTEIFIYPGFEFKAIDAMITNFHLPKSTLIMMVSAFAGRENILKAYEEAIEKKYRFFSFGDAILIM